MEWKKRKLSDLDYDGIFIFDGHYYAFEYYNTVEKIFYAERLIQYEETPYCHKESSCRHLTVEGVIYHTEERTLQLDSILHAETIVSYVPRQNLDWHSWYPSEHLSFHERFGMPFEKAVESVPIECLLKMAKRIAPTDYSTRFYKNPKHKMFYQNKRELLRAVRRSFSIGAYEHREQAVEIYEAFMC